MEGSGCGTNTSLLFSPLQTWLVGFSFTNFCRRRAAQVLVSSNRVENEEE